MRLIDADAFDNFLFDAEMKAIKQRKYAFSSVLNTIRGNLAKFPPIEPETRNLSFEDYSVALVAMWMDGIVTNEEYKKIMGKVIAHEKQKGGKK